MKGIKEVEIKKIVSNVWNLGFFEKGKKINFDKKRIYNIYEFSKESRRGFHAHKELKQVMFCPYGKIEVEFTNGREKESYILDDTPKILVYWREFISLKEGSILCVAASEVYNENDYIRDYEEYLKKETLWKYYLIH